MGWGGGTVDLAGTGGFLQAIGHTRTGGAHVRIAGKSIAPLCHRFAAAPANTAVHRFAVLVSTSFIFISRFCVVLIPVIVQSCRSCDFSANCFSREAIGLPIDTEGYAVQSCAKRFAGQRWVPEKDNRAPGGGFQNRPAPHRNGPSFRSGI
jgi:hypothetical protein